MRRPLRIVLSSALLVAALLSLAIALSATTLTYYLPPIDKAGEATGRTALFAPAIAASIVAGVTTVATAIWVALAAQRPRPRAQWLAVVGLVTVNLVVLVVTTNAARPTF